MIRYDVFRALNHDVGYPLTLFDVSLVEVKFDLPLPQLVCDAIIEVLTCSGEFERIEKLCSTPGIKKAHCEKWAFENVNQSPSYKAEEVLEDITGHDLIIGYVLHKVSVNEISARVILRFAIEGGVFEREVDMWIVSRTAYFAYCRGFEIARMFYYSDADEKTKVNAYVDKLSFSDKSKSLVERSGKKLRFRDMVNA